ncbi:unnamed protein product [Ophioblennius macclurei]
MAQAQAQAQARVTDFYTHKKRGAGRSLKTTKQRSGSRTRDQDRDQVLCSSAVHDEFVRVVDEAAGLTQVQRDPGSPRTPKRTSAEADFDLGSAVFSTTPKKRRDAEARASAAGGDTKSSARKKLPLPERAAQAAAQPPSIQLDQGQSGPVGPESRPPQRSHVDQHEGETTKALSREDVALFRSRLQRIKRHVEERISTKTPSSSVPATPPSSSETETLRLSVSRAKELAARAQRRKEDEEGKHSEAAPQTTVGLLGHQRYHSLAQPVPPGLLLPYTYKVLAEMFRSMDTVVAMLYNRCETVTFAKIQRGVQDMMHKRFEESHMGQIKCVFPEAYTFRQQKDVPTFNSSVKRGSYQLTVEPVLFSDQKDVRPVLSASLLLERRHVFHHNLVSIVKHHHKVFLSSLAPPLSIPEDRLTRWHPRFSIDAVPVPQSASLPRIPHTERVATAQEVLDHARCLLTPKMEKALVSVALKTEDKGADGEEPAPPQTSAPAALRGVPQSLLDRVRAKEVQKLQAVLTRDPLQDQRLLMMSRLGELARILRSVFVAEKKPALIMEVACNRLVSSYRSALTTGEMEKHVRLLAELASDWLSIHPIRKDCYLKLNKGMDLSTVLDRLTKRLKEEEQGGLQGSD